MGEAKSRGTKEERIKQAKERKQNEIKLTPEWAVWLLNLTVGPQLNCLAAVEPGSCNQFTEIVVNMIMQVGKAPKYKNNPARLITELSHKIVDLWNSFVGTKLENYLINGCPKIQQPSNIIIPDGIRPA